VRALAKQPDGVALGENTKRGGKSNHSTITHFIHETYTTPVLVFFLMAIQTVTAQQHDRYWLGRQADLDTIRTAVLMRFDGDSIVQRRSEYPA
jgi:hypothetical protein